MSISRLPPTQEIWWSNAIFFVSMHLLSLIGVYYYPIHSVPTPTLLLAFFLFQAAEFSITIGYHRLYSHKAFRAKYGLRLLVALVGASAMQGSIKWWCLRHRLHHRFTDDPIHDPYSATRGFLWSHMGWIFYKPRYERIELIDRDDLDNDPAVRFQHKYYVPLAVVSGLLLPPAIGCLWGDACGAFVWGSLIARLFIWHCTFLVNSLAHWDGLQPYSDENTSKSNLILAVLTCGEGNHNFHTFPHDYRSGPSPFDWDPSKWIIRALYALGLVHGLRQARAEDVSEAKLYMQHKHVHEEIERTNDTPESDPEEEWKGEIWDWARVQQYLAEEGKAKGRCVVVIEGYVLDVTKYLGEHPGGSSLLRKYSVRKDIDEDKGGDEALWTKADWTFHGGLNVHTRSAKRRMRELRVARLVDAEPE